MKKKVLTALLLCVVGMSAGAQVSVKTNLLYDATLTVNAGMEFALARKWSVDVSGNLNAWYVGDQTWKHWMLQPEGRYWFCDRFAGHFVGAHALGGQFNNGYLNYASDFLGTKFSKLKDNRYQGWYAGAGVAYGYAWALNRHWNLEAEVGAGWVRSWYDVYDCIDCERLVAENLRNDYFGLTKAAISLVYVF